MPPHSAQSRKPTGEFGALLRAWRHKRRLSQLTLALDTGISARHLSFIETGRSRPSPELVISLARQLRVPLRECNELLLAAGYAPRFSDTRLESPDMSNVQAALQRLLNAHDPYPGVALDRYWNVVLANHAANKMMSLLPVTLAQPRPNMFRAGLHPSGFAAVTENFEEWGRYLLDELKQLEASTLDPVATALLKEVQAYPNVQALVTPSNFLPANPSSRLLVPCTLVLPDVRLSLFTALATFGSPRNVTLAELTVELFYPVDEASAAAFKVE